VAARQESTDSEDLMRVSDADRDRALAALRDGFAVGRLTHDTFGHRVEQALRARASGELLGLVADLPRPRRSRISPSAGNWPVT
jgi:hypothetical protein